MRVSEDGYVWMVIGPGDVAVTGAWELSNGAAIGLGVRVGSASPEDIAAGKARLDKLAARYGETKRLDAATWEPVNA